MPKSSGPEKVKDEDIVTYYLQHNDDFTQIMTTLVSTRPMTLQDFADALYSFVLDINSGKIDLKKTLALESTNKH